MVWFLVITSVVCLALCYTLVPELLCHIWHIGTFYHGNRDERSIALTFDDGPDPRYTPHVLDLLKQKQAKATFFVVGENAIRYPELIDEIEKEGHELASHAYRHKHAWLRWPWETIRDVQNVNEWFNKLANSHREDGRRFYRPPWGAFNPFTRMACRMYEVTPVLWEVRAMDWKAGTSPSAIVSQVTTHAQPGTVVLCHDAGGDDGAPLHTIAALPNLIDELRRLGFQLCTVSELHEAYEAKRRMPSPFAPYPLWRRVLIRVWKIVEFFFDKAYRVLSVNALLRVGPARWEHGDKILAHPSVAVHDGCKALDIHFQSETLMSINPDDAKSLVKGLRLLKSSFKDVARLLQYHPDFCDVEVVMAHTLMSKGIELLGFQVEELPRSLSTRALQIYMRFLMGLYHKDGFQRLGHGHKDMSMKLVWMTRDELIRRYGEGV